MSAPVFDALGDPTRRLILEALAAGEQSVGTVVATLQAMMTISQPAVSQHLKVLREAGMVTARAEGTRRLYAIDPAGVAAAEDWLAQLTRGPFDQHLDALATEVARGTRARRTGTSSTRTRTA